MRTSTERHKSNSEFCAEEEMNFAWTEQRINQLRKLRATGMAFSKIGEILGTTKNSVIGKAHRLGIFTKPETKKQRARAKIYAKPVKPAKPAPKPASVPRYIGLAELEGNECRYPIGKDSKVMGVHLFCGIPTHRKSSYCKTHHAISWRQFSAGAR